MKQILKRLELIKTAIDIDDEEIIELQIIKLRKIEIDDAVINILDKLENLDYGSAVLDIEEYLSRFSGVMVYEDKEAQGLKLELKALEKKLQSLSEQKREYLNDIDEFNTLYHLKLGSIIQEILKLKKDLLEKEIESKQKKYEEEKSLHVDTKNVFDEMQNKIEELEEFLEDMDEDDERYEEINQVYEELKENLEELEEELKNQKETIEELEDDLTDEEFEQTKAEYEEFSEEYEEIKKDSEDILNISEDDKAKLKKLYRKASRLCHPDIVVEELKKQAHEIMQALNAAYSKKDAKAVQKILNNLEKGIAFDVASDKIDDKKILKAKIEELREKIDETNKEIETIKEDETFEIISELDDWDEYFQSMASKLEEEIQALKKQLNINLEDREEKAEIKEENNDYSKKLKSIEQPTFEKIRRYCSNLTDSGESDELSSYLAENGKMHKALIYDAMEQFLDELEDNSLTIIDWGCKQGLASALVLDYINEKELDIEIEKVILIEKDAKMLSRAMLHVDVLKEDEFEIQALHVKENKFTKELDIDKSVITLNLFANDYMPMDFLDIKYDIFDEAYFVCLSNADKDFVSDVYEDINIYFDILNISTRDNKIGKFDRYEKIFKTNGMTTIYIDEDEIPF